MSRMKFINTSKTYISVMSFLLPMAAEAVGWEVGGELVDTALDDPVVHTHSPLTRKQPLVNEGITRIHHVEPTPRSISSSSSGPNYSIIAAGVLLAVASIALLF